MISGMEERKERRKVGGRDEGKWIHLWIDIWRRGMDEVMVDELMITTWRRWMNR